MPEANVLFAVTAVVVLGLVAWVVVVLRTAKEPWSREVAPPAKAAEAEASDEARASEPPAKASEEARASEPPAKASEEARASEPPAKASESADATAEATAVVLAEEKGKGERG